jgi:6-phosphogluconolactonase
MPEPAFLVLDDFARETIEYVAAKLRAAIRARGCASFVLAGGGTPLAVYEAMTTPPFIDDIEWERLHFFWGDERLVPPDDPGSNFGACDDLLDEAPIPAENKHRIKGELPAAAAVADYTARLRAWATAHDPGAPNPWPRFDVVLLGLGEDGHTASLFPGSPAAADAPVIAVTANYGGRPAGRVTLTPLVFNDAARVIFLATGANKADAVYNTFHVDDPVRYPAQRIRPASGEVVWFLDRAAAARLD